MEYDYFQGRLHNVDEEHRRRVRYQMDLRVEHRNIGDPFAISLDEFVRLYRMPQHIAFQIIDILRPYMPHRTSKKQIPLEMKILCSLSFYASGSYQRILGMSSAFTVSQSMVSRALQEVTDALNHRDMLTRFIHFPNTRVERERLINKNSSLGMPRTLGFIDGTLVSIVPPKEDKQVFRSRKGFTALNVQIICDANLEIINVYSRFPGSAADPYIYRATRVREVMRNAFNESHCWLLGDSAYPHEPWLMTPLIHAPRGTPAYSYTRVHMFARNSVERCIGVLKARWRCLLCDRTLHYDPVKAGKIVNSCVVLHNFLTRLRIAVPRPFVENLGQDPPYVDVEGNVQLLQQADEVRQFLMDYCHERWLMRHEDE